VYTRRRTASALTRESASVRSTRSTSHPFARGRAGGRRLGECSYGYLNGVNTCEDAPLTPHLVPRLGFHRFVRSRSQFGANPISAFDAGLDLLKPATIPELRRFVSDGELSITTVDKRGAPCLTEMFVYHLIGAAPTGAAHRKVTTPAHAQRRARGGREVEWCCEEPRRRVADLAGDLRRADRRGRIGARPYAGEGGAYVVPPFTITPLKSLVRAIGARRVTFCRRWFDRWTVPCDTAR